MVLLTLRNLVAFVETSCSLLVLLIILGYQVKDIWKRIIIYGLIVAGLSNFTYLIDISAVRHPLNWLICIIAIKTLFQQNWWQSIKYFVLTFVFAISIDLITVVLIQSFFGVAPLLSAYTLRTWAICALIIVPLCLIIVLLVYYLRKLFQPWAYTLVRIRPESQDYRLFIALALQVALIFLCIDESTESLKMTALLFGAWLIVLGISIYIMYTFISTRERRIITSTEATISSNVDSLINSIRSQRHDFSNHLQVITALHHKQQQEELTAYLDKLNSDVAFYNDVMKIDSPFIAALVNVKSAIADSKQIRMEMDCTTSLTNTKRNILDIVRILGNLLDNAIEAAEQQNVENRWVKLLIYEKGPFLVFEISNTGTIIDADIEKLFQPGFTSKDKEHSGFGLYSARELAQKIGGYIQLSSTDQVTFSLVVPK